MYPNPRIVTSLPLTELWADAESLSAVRLREVGREEIADLLRQGVVRFAVADVGFPLRWIPAEGHFAFWKAEVKPRVVEPPQEATCLEDYPGGYGYHASEWRDSLGPRIILLERLH